MAKHQVYKKRGNGPKNTGESTFEQKEITEVPEIESVMATIDKSLDESKNIVVKKKKKRKSVQKRRRICCM